MLVYNPSHIKENCVVPSKSTKTHLDPMPYSQLVRRMISRLNEKKLKAVWMGGGGNENGRCLEMAVMWMGWAVDALAGGSSLADLRREEEDWISIDWYGKKFKPTKRKAIPSEFQSTKRGRPRKE